MSEKWIQSWSRHKNYSLEYVLADAEEHTLSVNPQQITE